MTMMCRARAHFAAALLAALVLAGTAQADPMERFVTFPTLGSVTGNDVRLRDNPGVQGTKVIGKAQEFDHLVVLSETSLAGDAWYEVEHPTKAGTAWISGQYLMPCAPEDQQDSPWTRFMTNMNQAFGITPAKARSLFGTPEKEDGETLSGEDGPIVKNFLEWKEHSAGYLNGSLVELDATAGSKLFEALRLGLTADEAVEALGKPESRSDSELTWRHGDMEVLTLSVEGGRLTSVNYQFYYDI